MCLKSKTDKFRILKKDLTVYKIFYTNKTRNFLTEDNVEIYSRYRHKSYKIGELVTVDSDLILHNIIFNFSSDTPYEINFGLHSYTNKKTAFYNCFNEANVVVCKCTIPKGSKVIIGEFCHDRSNVSNQIIVNKLIKTNHGRKGIY